MTNMENKYTIHVPTEQYGFLEVHCDTLVEAKLEYDNAKKVFTGEKVEGMSKLEWSKFKRDLFKGGGYTNEEEDKMSPLQKWFKHEVENTLMQLSKEK